MQNAKQKVNDVLVTNKNFKRSGLKLDALKIIYKQKQQLKNYFNKLALRLHLPNYIDFNFANRHELLT